MINNLARTHGTGITKKNKNVGGAKRRTFENLTNETVFFLEIHFWMFNRKDLIRISEIILMGEEMYNFCFTLKLTPDTPRFFE